MMVYLLYSARFDSPGRDWKFVGVYSSEEMAQKNVKVISTYGWAYIQGQDVDSKFTKKLEGEEGYYYSDKP